MISTTWNLQWKFLWHLVPIALWKVFVTPAKYPRILLMFTLYHIYIHTSIVCRSWAHAQTLHARVKKWTGNSLSPKLSPQYKSYTFLTGLLKVLSLHCISRYSSYYYYYTAGRKNVMEQELGTSSFAKSEEEMHAVEHWMGNRLRLGMHLILTIKYSYVFACHLATRCSISRWCNPTLYIKGTNVP